MLSGFFTRTWPRSLYHLILPFPFRSAFLLMRQEKRETRKYETAHFYFLRLGLKTINSDVCTHLLLKLFQFFVVIPSKIKMRKKSIAVITVISDFDTTRLTSLIFNHHSSSVLGHKFLAKTPPVDGNCISKIHSFAGYQKEGETNHPIRAPWIRPWFNSKLQVFEIAKH